MQTLRAAALFLAAVLPAVAARADALADANAHIEAYRFDAARAILSAALATDPARPELRAALGRVWFEMGAFERAVAELERAVQQAPGHAPAHYWLARAYGALGEQSGWLRQAALASPVRRAFERAVELDPGFVRARVGLTQFYLRAPALFGGSRERARAQIEALAELAPHEAGLLEALAHERAGARDRAEAVYARLRAETADEPRLHARVLEEYGAFLMRAGRPAEARTVLETAVQVRPGDPDLWEALGHARAALGDDEAARSAFEQALAINPWQIGARTALGHRAPARSDVHAD